jgi:integrase/recombinase XerD
MGLEGKYRPPDRSKYLLDSEIEELLEAARQMGPFAFQYLTFMANTGVRPSESNIVRAGDVHADECRIRVRTLKQKKEKDGIARVIHRDVDISPEYAKQLAQEIKGKPPKNVLFSRSRQALWDTFKRAASKAGLPESYTLYSIRHSRCIYLLEWTKDLLYTSRQMGHSSIDVTNVYWHCVPSKREDYVKSKIGSFGTKKKPDKKKDESKTP